MSKLKPINAIIKECLPPGLHQPAGKLCLINERATRQNSRRLKNRIFKRANKIVNSIEKVVKSKINLEWIIWIKKVTLEIVGDQRNSDLRATQLQGEK